MSDPNQPAAPDVLNSPLFLNVAFAFDKRWQMGPDGRLNTFPPGGGLAGKVIEIGPVDLSGLTKAQILKVLEKRNAEMALVATAITVVTRQLADALDALDRTAD